MSKDAVIMEEQSDLRNYTIPQLLRWRVEQDGSQVALREKDFGYWRTYSWDEYYAQVRKVALGLEKLGLEKGSKVALIGDNIPELLFVAIGTQALGGISAGIVNVGQLINDRHSQSPTHLYQALTPVLAHGRSNEQYQVCVVFFHQLPELFYAEFCEVQCLLKSRR